MSEIVKTKLKNAREAIRKKEFEKARDAALGALEYEEDNYFANVFLGLAYRELKDYEQSEQSFRKAIASDEQQLHAWQGIRDLYEETKNHSEYLKSLYKLAELYAAGKDAVKCAEIIQKIIDIRRDPSRSSPVELAEALALLLPESLFYPVLSSLPPPDPTNPSTATFVVQSAIHNSLPILEELVSIYEQDETTWQESEITKRRQRLDAPSPQEVQRAVTLELMARSKLPALYNEVLNHPNTSDELRRNTEEKLLEMKQQYLFALPAAGNENKAHLASELDELINGIVLLKIPNELAWSLLLESKDAAQIEDYDFNLLKQFIGLFPRSPLAKLLQAYFEHIGIPLMEDAEKDGPAPSPDEELDYIEIMMEVFSSLNGSILAHRIIAELYEQDTDYENAIKVSESGLELVRRVEQNWGRPLKQTKKAFNVILATSLVHYFPPKHHPRALKLVDEVLAEEPDNLRALLARGFILEHAQKWTNSADIFAKVAKLDPEGLDYGLQAKEEHAWSEAMCGKLQVAADELREVIAVLDQLEGRDEDKARAWWRLGRCFWEMGVEHREEAYKHFVTALKRSSTFAPAFTSLGIYYSEFLEPPDPNRASKCFQKAFELDPRESDAARRLAEGFAEEGEWDLVEVVARRTIEGEGGLEQGSEAKASRRYLPLNAWAWKAVGAVELTRRNYVSAIEALQIALRTDVDDHMSWLRLGEAYSKAGRYAAALKALERARELNTEDWVVSYFTGDVQRQMGTYDEAIKAFRSILEGRPQELGVLHSLGQTYLELGRFELSTSFLARAETSFVSAIRVTLELLDASSGLRRVAWKTVADSLYQLSTFSAFSDEDAVKDVVATIVSLVTAYHGKGPVDGLSQSLSIDDIADAPVYALQVASAAYEYRLSLGAINDAAMASEHYDLGVAMSAFARHTPDSEKREKAQQDAIAHFKNALRLEPGNDAFWVALGNATFLSQTALCQHSYVRALEIDGKNAATWTNLGMLYLHYEDVELANEAFYKAQTLDPDYALAWVGQGLVATANRHDREARALFEHATGLTAVVPEADLEYATRLFSKVNATSKSRSASSEALLPAFFVLDRYCKQRPKDASALHLFGLVCERIGHIELGIEMISRAISVLEAAYEQSEDPVIERQFTIAHANVARLRMAKEDHEGALESYQVATGLLPEQKEGDDADTKALLAQCQFGSGLANFKLGQLPEALTLLESAMTTAADLPLIRGHVVVLLAQTLWAIGTGEARESAKNQLLQSIEYDPENLLAINTLAGMGILTDDDGLVDAALSELLSLPLDQRHERDPEREVTYLLVQHHLGQGDAMQAISVAQKAVFAEPERTDVRRALASLALRGGQSATALAILGGSAQTEASFAEQRASLALHAVSLCLDRGNKDRAAEALRLAQKGIMLSPWNQRGWETLAYVQSRLSQ
ncbi:TPR-like protein [Dichomitus squalens]|uniref:TPR-like protein n=1 Tax=Dichomitus squalens TaxID=114155 RepID=A0A4Q9NIA5_9APHY|nr:TPR-like protein [Dichomitus squalens]TBU64272.1 TPR-like protein [Dichomitus squalens]